MESRENFSAISTMSPGSNGVRSFTSPGGSGLNGKRTPVTKKLIIKNLKVHNMFYALMTNHVQEPFETNILTLQI